MYNEAMFVFARSNTREENTMAVWRGWRVWMVMALIVVASGVSLAAENAVSDARMRKDVFFLASDECEGRGVTTKGINLAADYVAAAFKKAGLKPAGLDGSYFQPFPITGTSEPGSPNTLALTGPLGQQVVLTAGQQFAPLAFSQSAQIDGATLVFAGYGVSAKEPDYDDFRGIDVAGKVVVMLRKTPRPDSKETPFAGESNAEYAALDSKMTNAEQHHAAGVIFVNDAATARDRDVLMTFQYLARAGGHSLPAIHLRRSVLDAILQSSLGTSLADVEQEIDRTLKPHSRLLAGWSVNMQVTVKRSTITAKNIVGVLEGTGPHAQETVVVGAHYDHLGWGEFGSLARPRKRAIHHGADDNGSGTTTLMELARRLAQVPQRDRRLVFIAFSGEERGLLGSAYYCKHPLFPLASTVAMVNLDMVGRLRQDKETGKDKLQVHGTGTAKSFNKLMDDVNEGFDFQFQKVAGGFGPSDHASFYARSIPVLFFFTGDHPDYHRPSDTADKINITGMRKVADLAEQVILRLDNASQRPEFVKVIAPRRTGGPRGPRLGFMPAYGDDEANGVLVDGVMEGGPAAKAGIKEGDRIIEVGGKPVKNLTGYMVVMGQHKAGETIELGILRRGKKMMVKVKPE
jgi:hypothetical protein